MVSRRTVLKGAAAGSIAAIAAARGVAAAPADKLGNFGAGFGSLEGGAAGVFHKVKDAGFDVFIKFHKSAAQVFYKINEASGLDVFIKFLEVESGWSPVTQIESIQEVVLEEAATGFYKLETDSAGIFLKLGDGEREHYLNVYSDGEFGPGGPDCEQLF